MNIHYYQSKFLTKIVLTCCFQKATVTLAHFRNATIISAQLRMILLFFVLLTDWSAVINHAVSLCDVYFQQLIPMFGTKLNSLNCSFYAISIASPSEGQQPKWPLVLRGLLLPRAFYKSVCLEVIAELCNGAKHFKNRDGGIHTYVIIVSHICACVS